MTSISREAWERLSTSPDHNNNRLTTINLKPFTPQPDVPDGPHIKLWQDPDCSFDWRWAVIDRKGKAIATGYADSRWGAKRKAKRAWKKHDESVPEYIPL